MDDLTPKELALLANLDANEELRPFFFRKAKGLKWFDAIDQRNYFDPAGNPAPIPAKEEGYVLVPHWPVTDYLVATSPELLDPKNRAYAERVLAIIRSVTQLARGENFGNYRTWWQFSKIIQNIPLSQIVPADLADIDYWLDDRYERGLVARELGEKWLLALLNQPGDEAKATALQLLAVLYKAVFSTTTLGGSERKEASFRFDKWHAEKITKAVAARAGQVLGRSAVQVFTDELQRVLRELDNDSWSSLWHPAIEDHEQNRHADDVENLLVFALRDALDGWVPECAAATPYVAEMLVSPYATVRRVAVNAVRANFQKLGELVHHIVADDCFDTPNRHELWHLLHDRYPVFPEHVRQRVQELIVQIRKEDEAGNHTVERTAYAQAIWLAAIRHHAKALEARYRECVDIAGAEPDHPDFSSYSSSGWVAHESPKAPEELLAMEINQLVAYLDRYEDPGRFMEPGIEGLVKALRAAVKASPLTFSSSLERLSDLDTEYIYELIEGFSELWAERKELPWNEIWPCLLNFCEAVIRQGHFWSRENAEQGAHFVANRYWVVGSIGRLIEAGTKSDDRAFSPELLGQAKRLLLTLLEKETGEEFKPDSDAVSIAINSPRGRCLEALINLALRSCRLADKEGDGHVAAWNDFQPIFEGELNKPDAGEYEFITLLVNYLPNFLYMSREWVSENLSRIFDRSGYQKWLCAMQAYAYVNQVYEGIYNHLKSNGHFILALDDENLKDRVSEKIIQNIVIAFLNDYESLEADGSLIRLLLDRARNDELSQLIWFIWTLRKKDDESLTVKVIELWPRLLQAIDTESREGRKLASRLTTWSVFITKVDNANRDLILQVAAFAEEDYNSHDLLESIARISAAQPQEALEIWRALLQGAAPDHPEWAIRAAFTNFVQSGVQGRRDAYSIADEYLKRGNENPTAWLQEIVKR